MIASAIYPLLLSVSLLSLSGCVGIQAITASSETTETTEPSEAFESEGNNDIEETPEIDMASEIDDSFEDITLGFVGDIYLGDYLYTRYKNAGNSVTGFLSERLSDEFKSVDVMIANHEYVATDLPDSAKDTRQKYNYKAPVYREFLWNELGVDVVSLANNHAMDYGPQSLTDSLNALDLHNIAHTGAGRNLSEAKEAYITEINGKKIAILGSCRFLVNADWYATKNNPGVLATYDTTRYFQIVKDEITRLKEEEHCDFVAVYVHFGTEKTNEINSNQPTIAHGYIDSGADLVIGSHAHTLQGIEIYQNKTIYYNLGNFLFSSYPVDTMMVKVNIHEDNSYSTSIIPCTAAKYYANDVTGSEATRIFSYLESISVNAHIDETGNVTVSN